MSKENPYVAKEVSEKLIDVRPVGSVPKFDALLEKGHTTILSPRRVGGFGSIKKYAYDLAVYVPRDPMDGDEPRWLIEEDIEIPGVHHYPNERVAIREGWKKLDIANDKARREFEAVAEKGESVRKNPFALYKWRAVQNLVNSQNGRR